VTPALLMGAPQHGPRGSVALNGGLGGGLSGDLSPRGGAGVGARVRQSLAVVGSGNQGGARVRHSLAVGNNGGNPIGGGGVPGRRSSLIFKILLSDMLRN
jgi:hypothetical protein